MGRKLNKYEFIEKAVKKHGAEYNYSLVEYIGSKTKVKIICKTHGVFEQIPNDHLRGCGCKRCSGFDKSDDEALNKLIEIHDGKYTYPLFKYNGFDGKLIINCEYHGEYETKYANHYTGNGCGYCRGIRRREGDLLNRLNEIHNSKYKYPNLSGYETNNSYIKIICKEHGEFKQRLKNHILGSGCQECSGYYLDIDTGEWSNTLTRDVFIEKSISTHGVLYDYSLVEYVNGKYKVKIICKEHGIFEQNAYSHIIGCGCNKCNWSKGELKVGNFLIENNIEYETQWYIKQYPYDFYIPSIKCCIEYDGQQHFESIAHFGGDAKFENRKKVDKIKNELCFKNGLNLIRIPYFEFDNIDNFLTNEINKIKKGIL